MEIVIPNGPVFLVRDSLNSYKIGDNKQKLYRYQQEQSALTHHALSQQPGRAAAAGCGWQCSVQAQAARLGCEMDSQPPGDTVGQNPGQVSTHQQHRCSRLAQLWHEGWRMLQVW